MKQNLDWETAAIANIFDEVTLWSAPFGRLLLENIPMVPGATVVDIGFGTGFPLVELSQRFGDRSKIYGIDIWKEGINRTKVKIDTLELSNIEIFEESATKINLADNEVDLVTSNLGVNNFDQKHEVYLEIHRILKPGGKLCLTTNPIGTFQELFALFQSVFEEMGLEEEQSKLATSIQHRSTAEAIITELGQSGLQLSKQQTNSTHMRFADATALLNHSLVRIGFRVYWEQMIREPKRAEFFERLLQKLNAQIAAHGTFKMTIPMLYLEFEKA